MEEYLKYVGTVFDNRYRIVKVIGIGGMAVVFSAEDMLLGRIVALKMLRRETAGDEESVRRFINESKAVSMLSHPNIVKIYDVSVKSELKYIVMEYVEGITLKNYMTRRGVLSLKEILSYSEQILRALEHAHSKGIIHRDIKPQNIMLLRDGTIKVADFGIAKLPNAETVTMTDKAIGTVYYISPEQASGSADIDTRSDLYSLGIMMYEMATGELPFNAESPVSVALMHINDDMTPPRELNPTIPKGLEQIILAATAKSADDRYQTAGQMARHIKRLKENPKITFKRSVGKSSKMELRQLMSMVLHSGSMLPVILGVMTAVVLVGCISIFSILSSLFSDEADKSTTITVKDFVGSSYTDELAAWFEASDVYEATVEYVYDSKLASGTIISQSPKADSRRKIVTGEQLCGITLTVSRGEETMRLIDVAYMTQREAELALKNKGILYKIEKTQSGAVPTGRVVYTDPAGGSKINVDQVITVYVSGTVSGEGVTVPDFKGQTEASVMKSLGRLGLRIGSVTYEKSDKAKGTVIDQSVEPQSVVNANAYISFIVSGGKDYDPYHQETTPETDPPKPKPQTDPPKTKPQTEPSTDPVTDAQTDPVTDPRDDSEEPDGGDDRGNSADDGKTEV